MIRARFDGFAAGRLATRRRARIAIAIVLAWLVFVLSHYYYQAWRFLLGDRWEIQFFTGDPRLPFLGEALQRAGLGLGGAVLLVGLAVSLGMAVIRLAGWRFAGPLEALPFAASLGIGLYSYAGLVLALFSAYRPPPLGILAFGAPAVLWAAYSFIRRPATKVRAWRLPSLGVLLREAGQNLAQSLPKRALPWAGAAALAAGMALIAALAPEREYDALWYHLGYPRLYLQHGYLVDLPWDYVSLYPMTWELWFGYGLVFGGSTAAVLLHYVCLPLTALVVFAMTQRYAVGASPWLAVALFATIPTVIWEASTAYIDLALALHVTLGLYALLRYSDSGSRQWFLLGALNLGLALASKHLALVLVGLACLGLVIGFWRLGRGFWGSLGPALALGVLCFLPAFPWYLRSYLATGNPVFPELYGLFGAPPERWDALTLAGLQQFLDNFGRPRTLFNLATLPWHMTVHAAAYHGALGPLFLILLPFLALRRRLGKIGWPAGFALGFIIVWASPLASFQMRFLVPIAPILAILASSAFSRLAAAVRFAWGRRAEVGAISLVALLLFANLPPFTAFHERDRVGWEGWLNSVLHGVEWSVVLGAESQQAYLQRKVRSYGVWTFANRELPQAARVLTWAGGDQFYLERDWLWAYSTLARPVAWLDASAQADYLPGLRELGVTHLIVDQELQDRLESLPGGDGLPEGWFDLLYEDHFYTLYQVRWEHAP